jgi:hypothetical protein
MVSCMNPLTNDPQTSNNQAHTSIQPMSLTDLGDVAEDFVQSIYDEAYHPEQDIRPFAVFAPSEMAVPLIVPLPLFEDEKRRAFVMCRLLPTLALSLDASALVFGQPERREFLSLSGMSREGEELHRWTDVTRARAGAPQLGVWRSLASGDELGGIMGWALAGAVGCFDPECVEAFLERAGKEVLLHRFADHASRDEANDRLSRLTGLTWDDDYDVSEMAIVLEREEDAPVIRKLLESLATEEHPTPEQLGAVLEAHAYCAPMARAGYSASVATFEERGPVTQADAELLFTASVAHHYAREERDAITRPVMVPYLPPEVVLSLVEL